MRTPRLATFVCAFFFIAPLAHAQTPKQLFDAERWPEAAVALHAVVQSGSSAEKQTAQYRLAIALYHMGLRQPAYGFFSEIAEHPMHAHFGPTLLWLAKLAIDLPEPADVIERVGKYAEPQIAALDNASQRDVHAEVMYLWARYADRNRQTSDAVARYERVDRGSLLYGKAQILAGMAHVRDRHVVPAVQAFQRVLAWLDESGHGQDDARLRDLANLSMARAYYTAAAKADDAGAITVDPVRISAAAKYYRRIAPTSEYFFDAVFEDGWTRHMAGDDAHALGNLRLLDDPAVPPRAEAGVLEATILAEQCRQGDAREVLARVLRVHQPVRAELTRALDALDAISEDDEDARVRFVKNARGAAQEALADRVMQGYVAYDAELDAEKKRFEQTAPSFRSSPVGNDVRDALALATSIVRRQLTMLAHERWVRAREELDVQLAAVQTLTAALSRTAEAGTQAPEAQTRKAYGSWPMNGSAAPDPIYRAPLAPACKR
jgi:hypothetical protein